MGGGRKRGGGRRSSGPLGQPPGQQQHHVKTLLEQQAALAEAQLEQMTPASPGQQRTTAPQLPPPPDPDLLPIAFADGKVTVGDGLVLLDRISAQARQPHREPASVRSAAPQAASDMVLLSFAASKGATCMEDFALGAVSWADGGRLPVMERGWLLVTFVVALGRLGGSRAAAAAASAVPPGPWPPRARASRPLPPLARPWGGMERVPSSRCPLAKLLLDKCLHPDGQPTRATSPPPSVCSCTARAGCAARAISCGG